MQNKKTIIWPNLHKAQSTVLKALKDPKVFQVNMVCGRRIGKSTLAEIYSADTAINNPKSKIYWVSPNASQANKVYKEMLNAIFPTGEIYSNKAKMGDTEIVFKNGSKIMFRSALSGDGLRGEGVDYMILDEAAWISKDTFDNILAPMLGTGGKKLLICTTPKGKNWIFDEFNKGFPGCPDYPYYSSYRFPSSSSPYVKKDFLEKQKERLNNKIFEQEWLAEFIDSSSVFNNITDSLLLEEVNTPLPGKKYWAGVDIGLISDATALCIIDENGNLVKYYRWQNIESPELIQKIIDINSLWKFSKISIENNNQGLPIIQDIKRKINNIHSFNTNSKTKPEIINRLIHLFNMKEIKLVNNDYLRIELESFVFTQNDNGNIKFQASNGFHDDVVMSLAIAIKCFESNRFNADYAKLYTL